MSNHEQFDNHEFDNFEDDDFVPAEARAADFKALVYDSVDTTGKKHQITVFEYLPVRSLNKRLQQSAEVTEHQQKTGTNPVEFDQEQWLIDQNITPANLATFREDI